MLPLLSIKELSVAFTTEGQTTTAVKELSLQVKRGEILALVGESGSGKSVTSLSILQLLPQPPAQYTGGSIQFSTDGKSSLDLLEVSEQQLQGIRGNDIAMIFQEPMTSLNPVMTCGRQVMETIRLHQSISKETAREKVLQWFAKVKLPQPEELFNRYPHQLSGGQKQRVMIAMAMSCEPSLLICDEPTTALDVTVQKTILQLIRELQQENNMGVIFITHNLGVVHSIADRVAIMYRGELVEQGAASQIFSQPHHAYTKALIACRPALHPKDQPLPTVTDFLQNKPLAQKPGISESRKQKEILLEVNDLVVRFPGKKNIWGKTLDHFTAVNGVSFSMMKGETLGLVGESGCGKTTLGRTVLGLITPTSGSIKIGGKELGTFDREEWSSFRREVQLVFQDPFSSLNPRLTIGQAIMEPMRGSNKEGRKKKAAALLDRVNMPASMMDRYPHEFSGGQRQRIVIARALALDPDFLVCDESVSALDVSVQAQVLNLLNELKKDLGLTLLFISHDLSVVRYMSDRIMVMSRGQIVEQGDAETIYHQPAHPYTKELLSAIPRLEQ